MSAELVVVSIFELWFAFFSFFSDATNGTGGVIYTNIISREKLMNSKSVVGFGLNQPRPFSPSTTLTCKLLLMAFDLLFRLLACLLPHPFCCELSFLRISIYHIIFFYFIFAIISRLVNITNTLLLYFHWNLKSIDAVRSSLGLICG